MAKWPAPASCRRARSRLALGLERVEGRLHLRDVLVGAAAHQRVAVLEAPDAAGDAAVDEADARAGEQLGVRLRRRSTWSCRRRRRGRPRPAARRAPRPSRGSGRRRGPSPRRPSARAAARPSPRGWPASADVRVAVVADDGVPGVAQAGAHVAAHLAEADESDLHAILPPVLRAAWVLPRCRLRPVARLRRRSGEQAARHQQVAERRGRRRPAPAAPLITTGLEAWVKASSTTGWSMAPRPSSRNCGLNPVVMSSPSIVGLDRLRGLGLVAGAGVEGQHAVAERELDGGVALGDQGDALDRLDQRRLVDLAPRSGARSGRGCGPWGTRRRAGGSSYGARRRAPRPRSR